MPDKNDELDQGLCSKYTQAYKRVDNRCKPLSNDYLTKCIVASNMASPEAAALAHFRTGQAQFHDLRFIDSIRSLYFCIESLFANNKFTKIKTLKEFRKSEILKNAIQRVILDQPTKSLDHLTQNYDVFSKSIDVEAFLQFLFHIRGQLQHANAFKLRKWHPSRQHEFEHEAICLIDLVEEVCWNIAERDISATASKAD